MVPYKRNFKDFPIYFYVGHITPWVGQLPKGHNSKKSTRHCCKPNFRALALVASNEIFLILSVKIYFISSLTQTSNEQEQFENFGEDYPKTVPMKFCQNTSCPLGEDAV